MPTGKGAHLRALTNPLDIYYRAALEGIETGRRSVAQIGDETVRRGSHIAREVAALSPRALKVLDDARAQRKAAAAPPRVNAAAVPVRNTQRPVARPAPPSKSSAGHTSRTDWKAELGAGLNGAVDAATLGLS